MWWLWGAIEELAPVVSFFVFTQLVSFAGGMVAMAVAATVSTLVSFFVHDSIPRFALISTLIVILLSGVSLTTGNFDYFMAADTVFDGLFALLLFWSLRWHRPLLQIFFERIFAISDRAWRILTIRWGFFLLVLAALNELVRLQYSPEVWSYYKLGSALAIVLFGCYQFTLSARERLPGEANWLGLRTSQTHETHT